MFASLLLAEFAYIRIRPLFVLLQLITSCVTRVRIARDLLVGEACLQKMLIGRQIGRFGCETCTVGRRVDVDRFVH